jgi:predicted enzyme related to lactoylglutathione lyase
VSNPVVHFEILGPDATALHQFYGDLFGWKINADNPMNYGVVETGGEHAIGGGIGPNEDGTPQTCFYVQVDDPQAYLDRAVAAGGKVAVPVTEIPGMNVTFAQFTDPQGNLIGMVKG